MAAKNSMMVRVSKEVKDEVTAIAEARGITFGKALTVWKQGEMNVPTNRNTAPLAQVSPDVSDLKQIVSDLISQHKQSTREQVAGLSGLLAGQSQIAQAVNARGHQQAVMEAVARALEERNVWGRQGIMKALEQNLGVSVDDS